jgi:hypothetical protein
MNKDKKHAEKIAPLAAWRPCKCADGLEASRTNWLNLQASIIVLSNGGRLSTV